MSFVRKVELKLAGSLLLLTAVTLALFPVFDNQRLIWIFAFAAFVGGDTVTTSLIKRYDEFEEKGRVTRRLCGPNPSFRCAFVTRAGFFSAFFAVYFAVLLSGLGETYPFVGVSTAMIPVLVMAGGVLVTTHNALGMVEEEIGDADAEA